ncbi:hypothetical protein V1514DRAFT_330601 [Lipomyces japonicus]|uniref:uncharacterized protein n=1 Tax=Lipomyces japonicus TaxID=56871 RepID=UPI0034CE8CCD
MSSEGAIITAAPSGDDPVQQIYYYYEIAKGLNGSTPDEAADAYANILSFSSLSADKKARTLANSFIPDLFANFVDRSELASKAVEKMIDYCEDEDVRLRMDTIKKLPELAIKSRAQGDKELILDILIQLLQAQAPPEFETVKTALLKASESLPGIASRQIWKILGSSTEPELHDLTLNWFNTQGKTVLSGSKEFAQAGIETVASIHTIEKLNKVLTLLLSLSSLKGGENDSEDLTKLLDSLVTKAPESSALNDTNEEAKEFIAFLPKWVLNILNRYASSSSLIKYLVTVGIPAIVDQKLTTSKEIAHVLRLSVEAVVSKQKSTEVDIFVPKLREVFITVAQIQERDWIILEPSAVGLYTSILRAPSFPISTDNSPDLTPLLKAVYVDAQAAVGDLRKQLLQFKSPTTPEAIKVEKSRLQAQNTLEVIKEMLKIPTLRSATPPAIKFSWRPRLPVPKKAVAETNANRQAAQQARTGGNNHNNNTGRGDGGNTGKVRLKRRASEIESQGTSDKKARGNTVGGRKRGGRRRGGAR